MRINYRTHPALKLLKEEELLRHIHPKERVLFEENKDISEYMSTDIWRNRQMSKKPLFYITNEFQKNAEQSHNAIERVEDLPKDSLRINVTESETRSEFKPYTLKQIETKYKKDYELWY